MEKKLYMRIRAFVLVILLILTTLVIYPEQVLADTEVAADEETTQVAADEETSQVAADEETTQVAADEEVTEIISNSENQNDSDQPGNEVETDTSSALDEVIETTDEDVETVEAGQESEEVVAETPDETELDPADEAEQLTDTLKGKTNDQVPDHTLSSAKQGTGAKNYTPEGDFEFDPATGTITGYIGESKDVSIPPSINNVEVKHIGDFAFSSKQLTSVTIPDGVTTIGNKAFRWNKLTNVTIPDSVTDIGESAFFSNEISGIILSNNITKLKEDVLRANLLTDVKIPDNVTEIQPGAFNDNQLTSVIIPDSVTRIEAHAFGFNPQLTQVTIPASVTHIGMDCFWGTGEIQTSIPDSIQKIINAENQTIVLDPSIAQIREHCFEPNASLLGNQYVKAYSNIRRMSDGQIIEMLKMPIHVRGTLKGNRFEFTYKGQNAYADSNCITSIRISPPLTGYAGSTTNIRNSPHGSVTGTLLRGHKVSGTLEVNWVRFTYSGTTGYVYAPMLQADPVNVTRYIVANSIIRSSPNGNIITTLKMPILVNGTLEGAWLKFSYNGNPAYVATGLTTTNNPAITGYAKSAVNVRNAPGGSVIGTIPIGRQVNGVLVGNMVRFTYNNKTGYIYASLLQSTPVKVTRYIVANSIIRSSPNGNIITTLKMPILVSGTIEGSWLKFTYNGSTAYAAMSVTTTTNPPVTGYTKSSVNVRNAPNGSVIGSLPANRQVSGVLVGNWVKFTYSGKTGYIYASLLR
ncbi:MAG: leucine-rich repeat protein [Saccharofermentanales bacterium]